MSPPLATITEPTADTLSRMDLEAVDAAVKAADRKLTDLLNAADEAREVLFATCADAVRAGRTADYLETLIKEGKTPKEIEDGRTFTAAYLRRKVRERGVEPLKGGPKPRKSSAGE